MMGRDKDALAGVRGALSGRWSGVYRPRMMGVESGCFSQLASFLRQEVA